MGKKVKKNHTSKLKTFLRHTKGFFAANWPIFGLLAISFLLCFLNFDSKTFLTGWDNLHPEFNISLDLQRTFFSVWQEYRSTGLLAGMAHAADLPRLLLIYTITKVGIPVNLIRYLTSFLTLVAGPIGVYILLHELFYESKLSIKTIKFGAFLAGLYYLLNLSTLQTFFIPFETFTWFYSSLPFLIYFIILYLRKPTSSHLLWVLFISFLSGTAFYVETIFVVFFLSITPFITELIFTSKNKIKSTINSLLAISGVTVPNLYWLLPTIFYVKNNAIFSTQSRINIISSPETYLRNLEFGNLQNVFLLKSYLFKYLDIGINNKYDYLLSTWKNHLNSPLISAIGLATFAIIAMGIYFSFKEKLLWSKSFLGILIISFFFLLGGGLLINNHIPLVGELFRSPFTKFSIPLTLSYSYFFAIGVIFLLDIFAFLDTQLTYNLTLFTCVFLLIIYMSPAFSGNFISKSMRVAIPNDYFELFKYLDQKPKDYRIANFPQHTFWGWNYYSWPCLAGTSCGGGSYRGSGFLWYGIKQPILDRAFDVWEKTSQDYYEEVSTALYSQNKQVFSSIIDKYNVAYLLIDKSVQAPDSQTDLGLNYLNTFLENNPQYTLEKTFGDNILLYKNNNFNSQNFLSLSPQSTIYDLQSTILDFPLRPSQSWYEKAGFLNTNIILPSTIDDPQSKILHLPSLSESENLLPYKIEYQKNQTTLSLRLTPITPVFFLNKKQIDLATKPQTIQIPLSDVHKKFILNINSQYFPFELPSELDNFQTYYPITQIYLPTNKSFDVGLYYGIPSQLLPLTNALSNAKPEPCYYKPKINSKENKIEKILSPKSVTLLGTDTVACLSTKIPQINSDQLLAVTFTYYSPTLSTANVNITNENLGATNTTQPYDPSATPKQAQLFTKPSKENKQLNLILEAAETKTIQEITYKDVFLTAHDPIFEASVALNKIPSQNIDLSKDTNNLQISLPNTTTQFDINQISSSNALFPDNKNCDLFNNGETVKQINSDHILYQSRDAIECDYLNLRHFDHSLNYLIGFDVQNHKGLSLTTCLENHTTRRCDVFERLTNTKSFQYLLNPISNPQEAPGYTLHLFNQSLGSRITENRLNTITIRPFPLTFLQNISTSAVIARSETTQQSIQINSNYPQPTIYNLQSTSHPAEFLYNAVIARNTSLHPVIPGSDPESIQINSTSLNLYQTKSEHWKAFILPNSYSNLNPWQLTLKILLNYKSLPKLQTENCSPLSTNCNPTWYNSWQLPPTIDDLPSTIAIIYIPQYLEFFGFAILIITTAILLTLTLAKHLRPTKK